jgi:hypothetical protein
MVVNMFVKGYILSNGTQLVAEFIDHAASGVEGWTTVSEPFFIDEEETEDGKALLFSPVLGFSADSKCLLKSQSAIIEFEPCAEVVEAYRAMCKHFRDMRKRRKVNFSPLSQKMVN